MSSHNRILSVVFLLAVHCACSRTAGEPQYEARIRRTSFGIPHIEAKDLANLGFGEGYAHAEDHLCTLADLVVMARGEHARYLGPGPGNALLGSDIAVKSLGIHERAAADLANQPGEVRGWYEGYAAGYNHYLEQTGKDKVTGWCRGADWIGPISAEDLAAWHRLASLRVPLSMVAAAEPPAQGPVSAQFQPETLPDFSAYGASNGWALGKEMTENGRGILLANPHYLWVGALRFWEKQLTIPGQLNVYGAHILGVPGVAIGFNESVGWTHTISAGERGTFYALQLAPGKPTAYRYGNELRQMTTRKISVEVLQPDKSLKKIEHTAYFSHYGPVLNFPGIGWTDKHALAFRDANWDNDESWRQWLAMDRARSLEEFQKAHADIQGLSQVNTIAVSSSGVAWYADASSTPHLSREALDVWKQKREKDAMTKRFWQQNMVLLDGSNPLFEWTDDPGARDPGIVAYEHTPHVERSDYVFNANDSYWLSNSRLPLTGEFSPLHGEPNRPLSLRSRQNDLTITNRAPGSLAGEDGKFNAEEVARALFSNQSLTAELIKNELVKRCTATGKVKLEDETIDLSKACEVLFDWDGRYDLDSRGAVLFREFLGNYDYPDLTAAGKLFAVDFDPADPIHTPRELAPAGSSGDLALKNLARAVKLLRSRNLALDVPLGELQYANRPGRRIPVHGGNGAFEGILNFEQNAKNATTIEPLEDPAAVKGSRFLTEKGYPVAHGTSFVMVLEYTEGGPVARALLTYGESGDPQSEHFTDQMELFSKKQWRPVLFTEKQISGDVKREYVVKAPR